MANAMSAPSNFGSPVSTLDVSNLITTTQRAMEKSYDANLAKVDSLIESYTSIPLIRNEDKKYLGERLQTLLSAVDKNSKINWTSGSAARDVNSYISAAVDDNVLKQMANSQKIINFEQTAAERKAKNPELYNDANYIYAKDKGGYEAYMNGESNDLGSLQYIDYYDVKKNLTDEVEKFAKDRGFQKVLSQEEGTYVYKTVKGQEVKPEEIENFVKSAISSDSRLQQQLLIDSHAQYRGLKDEQVLEGYSKYINEEAKVYDTRIENLENEKKNTNKDDLAKIAELESQKTALNEEKDTLLSKANPQNFNRDSVQLEHYTKGLINNYAKTYSYSTITDIDYDDTLLQIAKAQNKLSADGSPLSAAGTQIGQQFDVAEEALPQEEQISNFSKIESDANNAWAGAVSLIKRNLIAQGKPATNKDIANYYAGLRKAGKEGFSINSGGYTDEEIDAYNKVTQNNIVLAKATNIAKTQYGAATSEVLNGLFGGSKKDLNKEGLAQTMPYTVGLLNKYSSADQMTKRERALALIEVANNAKNTIAEDDTDKKYYDLYINSVKKDNKLTDKDIPVVQKSGEQPGFWSGVGTTALGALQTLGGNLSELGGGITQVFKRKETAQKDAEDFAKYVESGQAKFGSGLREIGNAFINRFTSDRNLSEIQSGDINLKNYRDPSIAFKNATAAAKEQIERESEKYRANIPKGKSLVLNPDIKAEKPYVEQFASAIIAAGHNPAKDTYINLVSVNNGLATVKYQEVTDAPTATEGVTKKYTVDTTVQIPITNLPPVILNRLDIVQKDFGNSIKNPTPIVRSLRYSPPLDMDSKRILEEDYLKTSGSSMTQEELNFIRRNGIPDIRTKEDYLKDASVLPPAYFERFKQDLQSDYKVSWERPEGGGAFIGRLMKNGKEVEKIDLAEDYSPYKYKNYTAQTVSNYIEKRLQELRTEYQRTKY